LFENALGPCVHRQPVVDEPYVVGERSAGGVAVSGRSESSARMLRERLKHKLAREVVDVRTVRLVTRSMGDEWVAVHSSRMQLALYRNDLTLYSSFG
jgi:hypothetical protein